MSTSKPVSKCMFCNSPSYGVGCPYSPHKKHVHIANSDRCIYCGSPSLGAGCPYNPFSKLHVRGAEYNMMVKESVHRSAMTGLFLSRLTQPICEMPAFRLGLIDDEGRKIKECITEEEKAALTPIDMYVLKIRRLVEKPVVDLFKSQVLLEMASKRHDDTFCAEKYQKEISIISKIDHIVNDLNSIFNEAVENGFSKDHIENIIIQSILKDNNHV